MMGDLKMADIHTPQRTTDLQGLGLQFRLRREALGMSRREIARLMDVEESTVFRWEHAFPPNGVVSMITEFEYRIHRLRSNFKAQATAARDAQIDAFGAAPAHVDIHLTVPKSDAKVGAVFVFGQEERLLEHMPIGLIRSLAGHLIDDLQNEDYRIFARETDAADPLRFAQATCVFSKNA
jgi:transcriptional regulator with XRE-family HTH domain